MTLALQGCNFAFVTFADDTAAAAAVEVGVEFDDGVKSRVQPAKLLCREVLHWRAALRAKFAEVKRERDARPSEDPTEQRNAGNNFRALYPDMVVARKD